jgi:hypothetical protein
MLGMFLDEIETLPHLRFLSSTDGHPWTAIRRAGSQGPADQLTLLGRRLVGDVAASAMIR